MQLESEYKNRRFDRLFFSSHVFCALSPSSSLNAKRNVPIRPSNNTAAYQMPLRRVQHKCSCSLSLPVRVSPRIPNRPRSTHHATMCSHRLRAGQSGSERFDDFNNNLKCERVEQMGAENVSDTMRLVQRQPRERTPIGIGRLASPCVSPTENACEEGKSTE